MSYKLTGPVFPDLSVSETMQLPLRFQFKAAPTLLAMLIAVAGWSMLLPGGSAESLGEVESAFEVEEIVICRRADEKHLKSPATKLHQLCYRQDDFEFDSRAVASADRTEHSRRNGLGRPLTL